MKLLFLLSSFSGSSLQFVSAQTDGSNGSEVESFGKSIKLDSAELESLFNFDFDVEDDISSLLPPTFEAISESDEVTDYQPETLNELSSTKARKFTNKATTFESDEGFDAVKYAEVCIFSETVNENGRMKESKEGRREKGG